MKTAMEQALDALPVAEAAADCKNTSVTGHLKALAVAIKEGADNYIFLVHDQTKRLAKPYFPKLVAEYRKILAPKGYYVEIVEHDSNFDFTHYYYWLTITW